MASVALILELRVQSQKKPVKQGSIATRDVFANPEVLRQVHYWLKNFRMILKMSRCYTKYPDNMQSVQMNWKVSGQSKKCPDNLENVSG